MASKHNIVFVLKCRWKLQKSLKISAYIMLWVKKNISNFLTEFLLNIVLYGCIDDKSSLVTPTAVYFYFINN